MIYGYMRVSTAKKTEDGSFVQTFDLQRAALIEAGIEPENIFTDRISGVKATRPGLTKLLEKVKEGDGVVVWKLDRLGRSARNLLEIAEALKAKGVSIRSLMDGIDTSGKFGQFLLTILAAVAELERENISERVTAGIAASVRRGGRIGRKKALSPAAREDVLSSAARGITISQLAKRYRVSRKTIYNTISGEDGAKVEPIQGDIEDLALLCKSA